MQPCLSASSPATLCIKARASYLDRDQSGGARRTEASVECSLPAKLGIAWASKDQRSQTQKRPRVASWLAFCWPSPVLADSRASLLVKRGFVADDKPHRVVEMNRRYRPIHRTLAQPCDTSPRDGLITNSGNSGDGRIRQRGGQPRGRPHRAGRGRWSQDVETRCALGFGCGNA
jgi:hypothetical protein